MSTNLDPRGYWQGAWRSTPSCPASRDHTPWPVAARGCAARPVGTTRPGPWPRVAVPAGARARGRCAAPWSP